MGRDARSAARLRLAHRKGRLAKLSAVTPQARGARKTAQPIPRHQAPPPPPPPRFRAFPPLVRSPRPFANAPIGGYTSTTHKKHARRSLRRPQEARGEEREGER